MNDSRIIITINIFNSMSINFIINYHSGMIRYHNINKIDRNHIIIKEQQFDNFVYSSYIINPILIV